jgi:hypothetical protein
MSLTEALSGSSGVMATTSSSTISSLNVAGIPVLPFNGVDWRSWKENAIAIMVSLGWIAVDMVVSSVDEDSKSGSTPSPVVKQEITNTSTSKYTIPEFNMVQTTKLYGFLHLSVPSSIRTMIPMDKIRRGDGMTMWEKLCEYYEKDHTIMRQAIRRKLNRERLQQGEHIKHYIARITKYADQLKSMGWKVEDDDLMFILCDGLPEEYTAMVDNLMSRPTSFNDAAVQLHQKFEVMSLKKNDKDKATKEKEKEKEIVEVINYVGPGPGKHKQNSRTDRKHERGHARVGDDRRNGRDNSGRCFRCGARGHRQMECEVGGKKCIKCGYFGHRMDACREDNESDQQSDQDEYERESTSNNKGGRRGTNESYASIAMQSSGHDVDAYVW